MRYKAVITRARPDGTLDNVGGNNRIVRTGSIVGLHNKAQRYAGSEPYRIEFYSIDRFYAPEPLFIQTRGV